VFLKLIIMPVMAISLGVAFGLSGSNLAVVACCASVPSASNAYVLARQMGGDAPLLAQILTWQTALAVLTMPVFITFAGR
jgi:predicted permease